MIRPRFARVLAAPLLAAASLPAAALLSACASAPSPEAKWRDAKVVVVTPDQLNANTVQTPGMIRAEAISRAMAGSETLWVGKVTLPPGTVSATHHHGPLETVAYVVRGRARILWGHNLEHVAEAGPGEFMFVPPFMPHQETNPSATDPMEAVVIRSDQQPVVVELPDLAAPAETAAAAE